MAEKAPEHNAPATASVQHAPAPPPAPKVAAAPPKVASERYFELREVRQNEWFFRAPKNFEMEDVLRRDCWANVAPKLSTGAKIIVMREDCAFYAELIVFAVGLNWAETRVLVGPLRGGSTLHGASAADDYEIRYGGLIQEWTIMRKSDGALLKSDGTLKTEQAAGAWLREYLSTIVRRAA